MSSKKISASTQSMFDEMMTLLKKRGCILELHGLFENKNLFQEEEYHICEEWDGIQYKIPLREWNRKTGMNIKCICFDKKDNFYREYCEFCRPIYELNEQIDSYEGHITLEKMDGKLYVCTHGLL